MANSISKLLENLEKCTYRDIQGAGRYTTSHAALDYTKAKKIIIDWINNYSCPCGERGCCYEYFKEHKNGK